MKKLISIALVSLTAVAAHAGNVTCTTNTQHDPKVGCTDVTILETTKGLEASIVSRGGMAHFITAPKVISVTAQKLGPEVVIYSNDSEGFKLTVSYQPINGQIYGTLQSTPVVCKYSAQ